MLYGDDPGQGGGGVKDTMSTSQFFFNLKRYKIVNTGYRHVGPVVNLNSLYLFITDRTNCT